MSFRGLALKALFPFLALFAIVGATPASADTARAADGPPDSGNWAYCSVAYSALTGTVTLRIACQVHDDYGYPSRTRINIRDASGTVLATEQVFNTGHNSGNDSDPVGSRVKHVRAFGGVSGTVDPAQSTIEFEAADSDGSYAWRPTSDAWEEGTNYAEFPCTYWAISDGSYPGSCDPPVTTTTSTTTTTTEAPTTTTTTIPEASVSTPEETYAFHRQMILGLGLLTFCGGMALFLLRGRD